MLLDTFFTSIRLDLIRTFPMVFLYFSIDVFPKTQDYLLKADRVQLDYLANLPKFSYSLIKIK